MTPEQTLNKFIRTALEPTCAVQRIETSTGSGIPDLNVCWSGREFWIESKANAGTCPHIRPAQYAWMLHRCSKGGICFVIHRPPNDPVWNIWVITDQCKEAIPQKAGWVKVVGASVHTGRGRPMLKNTLASLLDNIKTYDRTTNDD